MCSHAEDGSCRIMQSAAAPIRFSTNHRNRRDHPTMTLNEESKTQFDLLPDRRRARERQVRSSASVTATWNLLTTPASPSRSRAPSKPNSAFPKDGALPDRNGHERRLHGFSAVAQKALDLAADGRELEVELIQDLVENELMRSGQHAIARSYILYREERKKARVLRGQVEAATRSTHPALNCHPARWLAWSRSTPSTSAASSSAPAPASATVPIGANSPRKRCKTCTTACNVRGDRQGDGLRRQGPRRTRTRLQLRGRPAAAQHRSTARSCPSVTSDDNQNAATLPAAPRRAFRRLPEAMASSWAGSTVAC